MNSEWLLIICSVKWGWMDVGCQSPGNKARRTIKEQTSRACVVLVKQLNQPTPPLWFKCDTFSKWRKCEHLSYYVAWFEPIRRAIWWNVKANLHPRLGNEYHGNEGPFMKRHKLQSRKDKNIERVDLLKIQKPLAFRNAKLFVSVQ